MNMAVQTGDGACRMEPKPVVAMWAEIADVRGRMAGLHDTAAKWADMESTPGGEYYPRTVLGTPLSDDRCLMIAGTEGLHKGQLWMGWSHLGTDLVHRYLVIDTEIDIYQLADLTVPIDSVVNPDLSAFAGCGDHYDGYACIQIAQHVEAGGGPLLYDAVAQLACSRNLTGRQRLYEQLGKVWRADHNVPAVWELTMRIARIGQEAYYGHYSKTPIQAGLDGDLAPAIREGNRALLAWSYERNAPLGEQPMIELRYGVMARFDEALPPLWRAIYETIGQSPVWDCNELDDKSLIRSAQRAIEAMGNFDDDIEGVDMDNRPAIGLWVQDMVTNDLGMEIWDRIHISVFYFSALYSEEIGDLSAVRSLAVSILAHNDAQGGPIGEYPKAADGNVNMTIGSHGPGCAYMLIVSKDCSGYTANYVQGPQLLRSQRTEYRRGEILWAWLEIAGGIETVVIIRTGLLLSDLVCLANLVEFE